MYPTNTSRPTYSSACKQMQYCFPPTTMTELQPFACCKANVKHHESNLKPCAEAPRWSTVRHIQVSCQHHYAAELLCAHHHLHANRRARPHYLRSSAAPGRCAEGIRKGSRKIHKHYASNGFPTHSLKRCGAARRHGATTQAQHADAPCPSQPSRHSVSPERQGRGRQRTRCPGA